MITSTVHSPYPNQIDRNRYEAIPSSRNIFILTATPSPLNGPELSHSRDVFFRLLAYVAILTPPAAIAFIINRYAVNVPFGDEWDTLGLVLADRRGQLNFAQLWAQHNEHRLLMGNITEVLTARLTGYNVVANVWLGFAFEVLALLVVWRLLVITLRGKNSVLVRPLVVYASLLMFWTVSWSNWVWGISSYQFLSSVFWAVVVVWALAEWPGRWSGFLVAFAAAVFAICTGDSGFPLLIIIPVGLIPNKREGSKGFRAQVGLFLVLSVIFLVFFFRGWHSLYSFTEGQPLWQALLRAGEFALAYLGSPFDTRFGWKASMPIGLLGSIWFTICAWNIVRNDPDTGSRATPWLLLGGYGILNASLTAYGRLHFGVQLAMSSRYTSIAITFWIGWGVVTALLVRRWARDPAYGKFVMAATTVVLVLYAVAYAISYGKELPKIEQDSSLRQSGKQAVLNYRTAPNWVFQRLHPSASHVREVAKELEAQHIGPFANAQPAGVTPQ
ncbi:MAG TPA: hypothetical protein VI756_24605 [Blastocatellia bacterium]